MNIKQIMSAFAAIVVMTATAAAQGVGACPSVAIDQKTDHVRSQFHINMGWDTAVTCDHETMTLTSTIFVPANKFNGIYKVKTIPYDPPEDYDLRSMLHGTDYDSATYNYPAGGPVQKLNINKDDIFDSVPIKIDFPFAFFGLVKKGAVVGDNGMLTFDTTAATKVEPYSRDFWGNGYKNIQRIPWEWDTITDACDSCPIGSGSGMTVRNKNHFDAVYVCYCDTDPRHQGCVGIFKGVTSDAYYPCRRIVVSWDSIDPYNGNSKNNYMVVCYEGTNVIEIYVKNFKTCNTSQHKALIGIQNKNGKPQHPDAEYTDEFNFQPLTDIIDGSPAAFWPDSIINDRGVLKRFNLFYGGNDDSDTIWERAWRFTPLGTPEPNVLYYRVFTAADGGDSLVQLSYKSPTASEDPSDSNGWYEYAQVINADTSVDENFFRIKAHIKPTQTSRYMVKPIFQSSTGFLYDDLVDVITVGVDTMKTYRVRTLTTHLCQSDSAIFDVLHDDEMQQISTVNWEVKESYNGLMRDIPSRLSKSDANKHLVVRPPEAPSDKVDTIMVRSEVSFRNGCRSEDTIIIYMHPLYDNTTTDEICKSDVPYKWNVNGQTKKYYESTVDSVKMRTQEANCDSIERLDLKVSDTMSTHIYVDTCDSYTWRNGKTYTTNNNVDTVVEHTVLAGCDSTLRLHLTLHPYKAAIRVAPEVATLDNLDIELTDVSTGTMGRVWEMPDGSLNTSQTVQYTMPFLADSAVFYLYAESDQKGCVDTAKVMVPMQRETFWVPNVVMPDDAAGNNRFRVSTTQTRDLECFIYNRMGQLVGHFEGIDGSWDCNDLNGNPCPQGSYVYVIRYNTVWNPEQTIIKKGTITLLR